MAQLHVLRKSQSLRAAYIAVILEDHHGYWLSGNQIPHDILCEEIQAQLNVGNGLHNSDGHGENDGNEEADKESPPGKPCWPAVAGFQQSRMNIGQMK